LTVVVALGSRQQTPRSLGRDFSAFSVLARIARALISAGQLAEAEQRLATVLDGYVEMLEVGLGTATSGFRDCVLPPLRLLIEVRQRLGKEWDARALARDLEETETIWASISTAALNELREEIRAETRLAAPATSAGEAGSEEAQGTTGTKTKKKLTRKKQKRKAAQRRKAEAAAAAAAVDGGAAAGGGEGTEGTVAVAVAVAAEAVVAAGGARARARSGAGGVRHLPG
jgi:hypothetical protein